jgi:hypothetical protein
MIQAEPESLARIIEKKQDAFTYLLSKKIENLDVNEQANYQDYKITINYVSGLISDVVDPATRNFFLAKATEITKIATENFSKKIYPENSYQYNKKQENYNFNQRSTQEFKKQVSKETLSNEESLLYYILQFNLYELVDKINFEILSENSVVETLRIIKELKLKGVSNKDIASEMSKIVWRNGEDSKQFNLLQRILFDNPHHEDNKIDYAVSSIIAKITLENEEKKLQKLRKEMSLLENNPSATDQEINKLNMQIVKLAKEIDLKKKD